MSYLDIGGLPLPPMHWWSYRPARNTILVTIKKYVLSLCMSISSCMWGFMDCYIILGLAIESVALDLKENDINP